MRSSKSRSRGNKNRNLRPTGGNIINRVFDSSGPDGKVRGTPAQIIEKYTQLHRDAQLAGDRVGAENFAQHAEHYTRMLAEAQREVDRAREEQEQFNRERQAERDQQMQREREARAERDAQRDAQRDRDREREAQRQQGQPVQQGERGDRERDRERDRDRDRDRERDRERDRDRARYRPQDDQPQVREDQPQGLPAFLTHGFAQSPASIEESGMATADLGTEDSGLVETPEMRETVREPVPRRRGRRVRRARHGPTASPSRSWPRLRRRRLPKRHRRRRSRAGRASPRPRQRTHLLMVAAGRPKQPSE